MKKLNPNTILQALFGLLFLLSSCSEEKSNHIVIKFENGDDLFEGALVRLNGLDVGKIESVKLNQHYEVCAQVKIDENIKIPTNSIFILDNESIFSSGIKVKPGNAKKFLKDNDTIMGIRLDYSKQDQIIKVFNELTRNAHFVKHQDSILTELKELNSHLKEISALDTIDGDQVENKSN